MKNYYQCCAVPSCGNTTIKTPKKLFIHVPAKTDLRNKWLECARMNVRNVSAKSSIFFCEDHFDMEKDIENYYRYKTGFSRRLILVPGVLPSRFHCQEGSRQPSSDNAVRADFRKRRKIHDTHSNLANCKSSKKDDVKEIVKIAESNSVERKLSPVSTQEVWSNSPYSVGDLLAPRSAGQCIVTSGHKTDRRRKRSRKQLIASSSASSIIEKNKNRTTMQTISDPKCDLEESNNLSHVEKDDDDSDDETAGFATLKLEAAKLRHFLTNEEETEDGLPVFCNRVQKELDGTRKEVGRHAINKLKTEELEFDVPPDTVIEFAALSNTEEMCSDIDNNIIQKCKETPPSEDSNISTFISCGVMEEYLDKNLTIKVKIENNDETQSLDSKTGLDEEYFASERVKIEYEDTSISISPHLCSWSEDFSTFQSAQEAYTRTPGTNTTSEEHVDIFLNIWDQTILEQIVQETNRYASQAVTDASEGIDSNPKPLEWEETTVEELYRFFAVLIYMSMCVRASLREYWMSGVLGMPTFRNIMSETRFRVLLKFLYFSKDNNETTLVDSHEREMSKINPIVEHCNDKFSSLYVPLKHLSVGESFIHMSDRGALPRCKQSNENQRIKCLELCEAETGYLLKCVMFTEKDYTVFEKSKDRSQDKFSGHVLKLLDGYLDVGHVVVVDKWHSQLQLARYLKSRRTDVIGSICRQNAQLPREIKSINETNLQSGGCIAVHCGDVALITWKDVTLLSTYHKDLNVLKASSNTPTPSIVLDYNKYMRGVDIKDQKLSAYLFEGRRGVKRYILIFKRLLNTSLYNSYLVYRKTTDCCLTQREFRYRIAEDLLRRFPRCSVTRPPSLPTTAPDLEATHFPVLIKTGSGSGSKRRRCVCCQVAGRKKFVAQMCSGCDAPLCVGKCWADYHTSSSSKELK